MTLRDAKALRFSPQGLSDALAEEDAFPGACSILQNLIPDPSTKNLWTPRPAAVSLTIFGSFTSPTGVVVMKIVGSYVYGLVSTSRFAGKDEPFCFNLATNTFVTVTGVTTNNVPLTQSTSGDWTPPTMDVMGVNVVVTHPGFDGVTNFIGWFDITTLSVPVWHAGNFNLITPLATVTITNGGTGYTTGSYTNVPLTGGTGSGALANITVSAGHVVTVVTVTNGGVGYHVGDHLSASSAVLGVGGSGLVLTVATVSGSAIATLAIGNVGSGYTNGSPSNVPFLGGTGGGATGNFVVSGGAVSSVAINNAGSGYLVGDVLTVGTNGIITSLSITSGGSGYTPGTYSNHALTGGTGTGATADITVSGGGVVTVATINNPGSGYTVNDALTIATDGAILTVTRVNGSGYNNGTYTNVPLTYVAAVGGPGSGATANMTVSGGAVTVATINSAGANFSVSDVLTIFLQGSITGGSITNAGSGYTNGNYTAIALTGGTGTGMWAGVTVSGGVVTVVNIINGGHSYTAGDFLSSNGIGPGNGFSVHVLTVANANSQDGAGAVESISLVSGGSGYTNGTYAGINLTQGTGSNSVANIIVSGGSITSVNIIDGGFGYLVSDVVGSNPSGMGAGSNFHWTVSSISGQGIGAGINFTLTVNTINSGGIGPGSGVSLKAAAVTSGGIGGGTGFNAVVTSLTTMGGFINFTTIPSWVRQFNGRSWFGINPPTGIPSVIFSDVYALNATNANQVLSFGDNTPLTAAAPLGLANLLGGVVQALIIFKSLNGIIQVTGDATTNNLSVNQVPGGSGTLSPRSLTEHPQGLLYLDHDGYRMVTLDGNCTDPIGVAGQGVVVPFLNPTTPTRVAAGCNGSILRVSVRTESGAWQAYWFDTVRKVWSGPHTDPSTMYDTYQDTFVIVPQVVPAALFDSSTIPYATESFTEFGVPLTWTYQTVTLMDNMEMCQSEVAEMQVKVNDVTGVPSIVVSMLENSSTINSMTYTFAGTGILAARQISFNAPVVYNRMAIKITGASAAGFRIGDIFVRARQLKYLQLVP